MQFKVKPATAFLLANIPVISSLFISSDHATVVDDSSGTFNYPDIYLRQMKQYLNHPGFVLFSFYYHKKVSVEVQVRQDALKNLAYDILFPTNLIRQTLCLALGIILLIDDASEMTIETVQRDTLQNRFEGVMEAKSSSAVVLRFLLASILTAIHLAVELPVLAVAVITNMATTVLKEIGFLVYHFIFAWAKASWTSTLLTNERHRERVGFIEGVLEIPGHIVLNVLSTGWSLLTRLFTPKVKVDASLLPTSSVINQPNDNCDPLDGASLLLLFNETHHDESKKTKPQAIEETTALPLALALALNMPLLSHFIIGFETWKQKSVNKLLSDVADIHIKATSFSIAAGIKGLVRDVFFPMKLVRQILHVVMILSHYTVNYSQKGISSAVSRLLSNPFAKISDQKNEKQKAAHIALALFVLPFSLALNFSILLIATPLNLATHLLKSTMEFAYAVLFEMARAHWTSSPLTPRRDYQTVSLVEAITQIPVWMVIWSLNVVQNLFFPVKHPKCVDYDIPLYTTDNHAHAQGASKNAAAIVSSPSYRHQAEAPADVHKLDNTVEHQRSNSPTY